MNALNSWDTIIAASIQNLWIRFITILPSVLGAIIVLIFGFLAASVLESFVRRGLRMTGIDTLMHEHPLSDILKGSQIFFTPSIAVGWLVKWFFILVTLIAVANSLGWSQINDFLSSIAFYIPNVLIAIVILVAGLTIGRFIGNFMRIALGSSALTKIQAGFLASLAQSAVTVFAVMASLVQLRIATSLIQILFSGIVFSLSIAFGLAFGLGGRDKATALLESAHWGAMRKRNGSTKR